MKIINIIIRNKKKPERKPQPKPKTPNPNIFQMSGDKKHFKKQNNFKEVEMFYSSPSCSIVGESIANTILHHRVSPAGLLSVIHQTCLLISLRTELLFMISFLRLSESQDAKSA